jgi:Amt family ammonium transporter
VTGLFYGGGLNQVWAELIGVATCFITLSVLSFVVFKIADAIVGNRIEEETEIEGLDVPEMGVFGYSGIVPDRQAESPVPR